MNSKIEVLKKKLKDERSNKVVFVSHCILNENSRYFGGAFRKGCVSEVLDELQRDGIGIVQMKCPEQIALGGISKPHMWSALGSKNNFSYKFKWFFMPLFIWNTKRIYRKLAGELVNEIEDYKLSGYNVVGVIGVDGSPSCGVHTFLDIEKSFEYLCTHRVSDLDRKEMNQFYFNKALAEGSGLFTEMLKSELKRKNIEVKFYEWDLILESEQRTKSVNLSKY